MKKTILLFMCGGMAIWAGAQDLKSNDVPVVVKKAQSQKFPATSKVYWEKEKGNYEANWGGKSREDSSALFNPSGAFIEWVRAIPVSSLPAKLSAYVSAHYHGAVIREAGSVTDAAGKKTYETEIKGKDLIFDLDGNFIREDK